MAENDNNNSNNSNVVLTIIAIVAILAIAFYAIQFFRPQPADDVNINLPDVDVIPNDIDDGGVQP